MPTEGVPEITARCLVLPAFGAALSLWFVFSNEVAFAVSIATVLFFVLILLGPVGERDRGISPDRRPPLLGAIAVRLREFVGAKWRRLGLRSDRQSHAIAYLLGTVVASYSILDIVYDLNIVATNALRLPFSTFYREEIVPFLASPVRWVGLDFDSAYEALIPFSLVGAKIWADAEFRINTYVVLYPCPKLQPRPGWVDPEPWTEPPKRPKPPSFFSLRSRVRSGIKSIWVLAIAYSLLGLVCSLAGLIYGLVKLLDYLKEVGLLILGSLILIVEQFLARHERSNEQNYWGTKLFLAVYDRREEIDQSLHARHVRQRIIVPGEWRLGRLFQDILEDAGRTLAPTLALLILLALIFGLL